MQKSKKIALIILGSLAALLLIYALAGFLGVPYALKNTLPAKLKDMNASFSVAEAKFNPFTFELNVTRPELNTTAPLFSAEQIDVKLKPFSLFKKLAEVDILRLESPSVNIARDKNGTLNLATFLGESNATSAENNETSGINFALNSTKIIGGSFAYSDESLKQPFSAKIEGINYEISGINTEQNSAGKHVFDANSTLAQKLDWQGGIDLAPLRVYGELSLKDFNVRPVAISFIDTQDLRINSALINAKTGYELSADGGIIKADAAGYFEFIPPVAGYWGFAALGAGKDKQFAGKELSQDAVIWIEASAPEGDMQAADSPESSESADTASMEESKKPSRKSDFSPAALIIVILLFAVMFAWPPIFKKMSEKAGKE